MSLQKLSQYTYILLILANFIYLFTYGFKPLHYHPSLLVYNLLFFFLVSLAIFLKASHLLYRWFVKQQGDFKAKAKIKVSQLLKVLQKIQNVFAKGNQQNLLYVYLAFSVWNIFDFLVPSFLLGIYTALLYELRSFLLKNYKRELDQYKAQVWNVIDEYIERMKKYSCQKMIQISQNQ